MKIALIGGTGFVGTPVLAELLSRGHEVTLLARTPSKVAAQTGLTVVQADILHAEQVAQPEPERAAEPDLQEVATGNAGTVSVDGGHGSVVQPARVRIS